MADPRSWMDPSTPFFFKPLNEGFLDNFSIPISFLKHLKFDESNNDKSFTAVLKNASIPAGENGEVKAWLVKVDTDGRRFMDGWKEFAKDQNLSVREFVVFRHLGDFVFDVLVFDAITACLRSPPADRQEEVLEFVPSEYPYFQTTVQKYCFEWHAQLIPTDFARENNLAKRWCEVTLIDQKDRSWTVNLRHRKTGKDQVYLSSGWDKVRDAHKLKIGDSMVFEVIDSGSEPVIKFYKLNWF